MPEQKKQRDRFCTRIDVCVNNEINDAVEQHQSKLRLKGQKLRKFEAAERYFEMLHDYYNRPFTIGDITVQEAIEKLSTYPPDAKFQSRLTERITR